MAKKRKRKSAHPKDVQKQNPILKGFHSSQKDNSKRAKHRAGLNNYKDDKEDH